MAPDLTPLACPQALEAYTHMALWLTVPLGTNSPEASTTPAPAPATAAGADATDSWESWNQLRTLTDADPLLGVMLKLGQVLPHPGAVARWLGEPVKALVVPTSVFTTNKRGYPVLSKAHQDVIIQFFKLHVQVGRGRAWAAVCGRDGAVVPQTVCSLGLCGAIG